MDVYCAPNTGGESFGVILLEAMASRTPVVASDLEAFRRVLAGGTAGRLFPTGDAEALAAALREVLDDPDLRARLVEAGDRAVAALRLVGHRHRGAARVRAGDRGGRRTALNRPHRRG